MGGEFIQTTLGEVVKSGGGQIQTGPFGSQLHASDYVTEGVPVIMPLNISGNRVDLANIARITEEDANNLSRHILQKGDIIYSRRGDVTRKALITDAEEGMFCGTGCLLVRPGSNIDSRFLTYHLSSPENLEWITRHAIGATMPNLNTGILAAVPLRVPNRETQKSIAHILGSLDDKIELNRRMNATLESMAQALFKSWFVDFDPVIDNALAAGNPIPEPFHARAKTRKALGDKRKPLPEALQQQFPSSFAFTEEMGWIPEGWEIIAISKMVKSISDTYPLENVDKVIFLNTGDIVDGKFLHRDYSSVSSLPGQAKKSIKAGDILFSEIRPKNKRFAFVSFNAKDYVVSTKLMVLRTSGRFNSLFPYFLLKQENNIDYLQHIAEARSGTFPQITFTQLDQIITAVPTDNVLIEYFTSNVLEATFNKSLQLYNQSEKLVKVRDTLLPKLLSGQLRIPDAEKLIADAL